MCMGQVMEDFSCRVETLDATFVSERDEQVWHREVTESTESDLIFRDVLLEAVLKRMEGGAPGSRENRRVLAALQA